VSSSRGALNEAQLKFSDPLGQLFQSKRGTAEAGDRVTVERVQVRHFTFDDSKNMPTGAGTLNRKGNCQTPAEAMQLLIEIRRIQSETRDRVTRLSRRWLGLRRFHSNLALLHHALWSRVQSGVITKI